MHKVKTKVVKYKKYFKAIVHDVVCDSLNIEMNNGYRYSHLVISKHGKLYDIELYNLNNLDSCRMKICGETLDSLERRLVRLFLG